MKTSVVYDLTPLHGAVLVGKPNWYGHEQVSNISLLAGHDVECEPIVATAYGGRLTCPSITPTAPSNLLKKKDPSRGPDNKKTMESVMRNYFGGDDFFRFMAMKEFIESLEKDAFKKGKEDKDDDPEIAFKKAYDALKKKRTKESKRFSSFELGIFLWLVSPFIGAAQILMYKGLWQILTH